MKDLVRLQLILPLAAFLIIAAAIALPFSTTILHSHAASPALGTEPAWALPFPTGTSMSIGPKGIHGDNFSSITDDTTHTLYKFSNPKDPDSLDMVLEPEQVGISSIATAPLAGGTVLAVWAQCHLVLIDHGGGWWSMYLHLTNIQVASGDVVTVNTKIGNSTTNVQANRTCGNEQSTAEHTHIVLINQNAKKPCNKSTCTGDYIPMLGRVLCGHRVVEQNNDPTNIILQGLTQTKGQVFTVPACGTSSSGTITEFSLPRSDIEPRYITTGPDGAFWFTEFDPGATGNANQIWRMTTSGGITNFSIPTANSTPGKITPGPDGAIWFVEIAGNKIGRITTSGAITEFSIPTANSAPSGITSGPDGTVWFTESNASKIGRITPTGAITEFSIPTANSAPSGLTTGSDGNLWFVEANGNQIGRITTSGVVSEFPVPTANSQLYDITAGPNGNLWFVEASGNQVGRITTSGTITEFPLSAMNADPLSIISGPDGAVWFTEFGADKIGRITPTGVLTEWSPPTVPSGPSGITKGPDSNLWFTEYVARKIGRITT